MHDGAAPAEAAGTFPIGLRMAESLRELQRAVIGAGKAPDLIPVAEHLEAGGSLHPEAYAAYFDLVRIVQGASSQPTKKLAETLARSARPRDAGIAIRMLGFEEFGRAGTRETRAHFQTDSLRSTQMAAIPLHAHARIRRRLNDALGLIEARAPVAWSDVSRITTEIVAAYGVSRGIMTFDGCSSLERYGSILVNMRRQRTRLVMAETLVHESAHSLLFALSCNDHRVLNPPTERHRSPLRIDPRPLDGIFHAVFVLARMHGFVAEVALHPGTTPAMRAEARKVLAEREKSFRDGHSVLMEHARFSEIGRELLDDAHARVERAAGAVAALA